MTSLTIKGTFELLENNTDELRLGVNLNGNPSAISAAEGVIMSQDGAGLTVNQSFSNVTAPVQALITANNALYQRRRVAWAKLRFIPKYNSFVQDSDQTLSTIPNQIVYSVTDMDELETDWRAMSIGNLLANSTGVKYHSLYKPFKVFRRSAKYPYSPKYIAWTQANDNMGLYSKAGMWRAANVISIGTEGDNGHIAILATNLAFGAGETLYSVVFEYKLVWADRNSV